MDTCRDYLRSQQELRIKKYFASEKKAEKSIKESKLRSELDLKVIIDQGQTRL